MVFCREDKLGLLQFPAASGDSSMSSSGSCSLICINSYYSSCYYSSSYSTSPLSLLVGSSSSSSCSCMVVEF
jgi:hypothetical protein